MSFVTNTGINRMEVKSLKIYKTKRGENKDSIVKK